MFFGQGFFNRQDRLLIDLFVIFFVDYTCCCKKIIPI